MNVSEREDGDLLRLQRLVRSEHHALQRDRYRAVVLALGGAEATVIAATLDRSRRAVQDWAYLYRDGGIDALKLRPRGIRPTKLSAEQAQAFRARFLAGPTDADGGICTLRGRDAVRILREEFGVRHTMGSIYQVLARLGLSPLRPRPRHRKADPEQQRQWLQDAPLFSAK